MDYYLPEPPPNERKNHTLRNMVIGGFGCLFLIGAVVAFILMRFSGFAEGPTRAVRHHLNSINQGNIHTAYSDFTTDYKKHHTMDDFQKELSLFADQLPCRTSHFSRVNVVNEKAEVGGTLTGRDGSLFPVEYQLIREKGEWKIQTYHWEPPGEQQSI
ncbi:MAG TPA: hypothetical protein VLR94_10510 [Acidobacteriota bacterium]|nr:hypothetical protein [Acidobacteriota bacterium]